MLAQITLPTKWSYAPVTVKFVSYAPAPTEHPLYLRGGDCKPLDMRQIGMTDLTLPLR